MRNENTLKVNGQTRSQAAAKRIGLADWQQEVDQLPEPADEQAVVGLGEILRGEVELTTRTQGGAPAVVKIPHTILAILVTIALALIGGGFWLVSSVTEMKTNLAVIQASQREAKAENTSNLKLMTAYATNETNRINFLTGMLTVDQQRRLYDFDRANPRPELPTVKETHPDQRNQ